MLLKEHTRSVTSRLCVCVIKRKREVSGECVRMSGVCVVCICGVFVYTCGMSVYVWCVCLPGPQHSRFVPSLLCAPTALLGRQSVQKTPFFPFPFLFIFEIGSLFSPGWPQIYSIPQISVSPVWDSRHEPLH